VGGVGGGGVGTPTVFADHPQSSKAGSWLVLLRRGWLLRAAVLRAQGVMAEGVGRVGGVGWVGGGGGFTADGGDEGVWGGGGGGGVAIGRQRTAVVRLGLVRVS